MAKITKDGGVYTLSLAKPDAKSHDAESEILTEAEAFALADEITTLSIMSDALDDIEEYMCEGDCRGL